VLSRRLGHNSVRPSSLSSWGRRGGCGHVVGHVAAIRFACDHHGVTTAVSAGSTFCIQPWVCVALWSL
jgi:hypothetical protein